MCNNLKPLKEVGFPSGSHSLLWWICDLSYVRCVRSQVIYVSRNPKDVAVSFYHFHKLATFLPEFSTFQDFLHHFLEGTCESRMSWLQKSMLNLLVRSRCVSVCYGSWFDHVKGWTNRRRAPGNLLHVTYEDMSLVKWNTDLCSFSFFTV